MKNTLYVSIILSSMPIHAATSPKSYTQIAQEEATHLAQSAQATTMHHARAVKAKAIQQFNESYNRFQQCLHGKCTKGQALKVARDLGIAAAAVITTMYIAGGVFKKGANYIYRGGEQLQRPGKFIYEKASRVVYPFKKGDWVKYRGPLGEIISGEVISYDPLKRTVKVQNYDSNRINEVKADIVKLIEPAQY